MLEKTINISFPIKENLLLSLRESQEEFTQDLRFFISVNALSKRPFIIG